MMLTDSYLWSLPLPQASAPRLAERSLAGRQLETPRKVGDVDLDLDGQCRRTAVCATDLETPLHVCGLASATRARCR